MSITLKKKNFAKSTLASGITSGATSLTVATGEGAKFPASGKFRAVLWGAGYTNPSDEANAEVVEAELSSGDAFTITRAKEGTTARAWSAGDNIAHTITAETIEEVGQVVQVVHSQTGAYSSGTAQIPFDDTVPQNTEGTEFMTAAITPADANNTLLIEVLALLANNSSGGILAAALFKDSDAGALAVGTVACGADRMSPCIVRHEMAAGTTSQITFKVRAGASVAGTTSLNGSGGARLFGGTAASSIRITEYKA